MKVSILQKNLKNGLVVIERVIPKSFNFPILGNVLLSCDKTFICLSATDLEIAVHYWILGKTEKEGKIIVPAKLLVQLISSLPEEKIYFETKNNTLFLSGLNWKSQLRGQGIDDFPVIPEIEKEFAFDVNVKPFYQGLGQVIDITSNSSHRPELTGVYCKLNKKQFILATTDSFRLAEKSISFSDEIIIPEQEYSFIIPQKIAREFVAVFGDIQGKINISLSQNQIAFEYVSPETSHPQIKLFSRLLEGEYPNYKDIIPQKHDVQVTVPRSELVNQIKTASYFSSKTNEISFHFIPEKGVEVISQNPDSGEYASLLKGKCSGEEFSADFNWKFIADGLVNIKSNEVVFMAQKNGGPATLRPVGDSSYVYVVMPVRAA